MNLKPEKCDFVSKFIEEPYNNEKFPKENFPFQYKVDVKLCEKFEYWSSVFMSILVDLAFKNQGYGFLAEIRILYLPLFNVKI